MYRVQQQRWEFSLFLSLFLFLHLKLILATNNNNNCQLTSNILINTSKQVQDTTEIHNELNSPIFYECDFFNKKDRDSLRPHKSISDSTNRTDSDSYWACCKFVQPDFGHDQTKWKFLPPRSPSSSFDPYMGLAFIHGAGKTTDIYLRPSGIYVSTSDTHEAGNTTSNKGNETLLASWELNAFKNYTICPNPKIRWLNSHGDQYCLSECKNTSTTDISAKNKNKFWCSTGKSSWSPCTPHTEYNISDYAVKNVLSSEGRPCRTECSLSNGTDYNWCFTRKNILIRSEYWDYCSPKSGFDYKGRSCTGECGYQGNNYKWCKVQGKSWGYCS